MFFKVLIVFFGKRAIKLSHSKGGNNLGDSTTQSKRCAATALVGSIYNIPNTCSTAEGIVAANHRLGSDGKGYCQGQPPLLNASKEGKWDRLEVLPACHSPNVRVRTPDHQPSFQDFFTPYKPLQKNAILTFKRLAFFR